MAIIKFLDKKLNVELKDEVDRSIANEIFKFREYRVAENVIRSCQSPIIDGGAHIGLFTLYVRVLNPDTSIIVFEPENSNYERLQKTIEDNSMENIHLENFALASDSGKRQLVLSNDSHNHYLSAASDQLASARIQPCRAVSLLDYCERNKIKKIGLLKLDIEGGEFELLRAWGEKEFDLIETLILEYHNTPQRSHKELIKILGENKFGVQSFTSQFDRSMGFIFARRRK